MPAHETAAGGTRGKLQASSAIGTPTDCLNVLIRKFHNIDYANFLCRRRRPAPRCKSKLAPSDPVSPIGSFGRPGDFHRSCFRWRRTAAGWIPPNETRSFPPRKMKLLGASGPAMRRWRHGSRKIASRTSHLRTAPASKLAPLKSQACVFAISRGVRFVEAPVRRRVYRLRLFAASPLTRHWMPKPFPDRACRPSI